MNGFRVTLEAGEETEDLAGFVLDELGETAVEELTVEREFDRPDGLASEPITISVVLATALGTSAIAIGRVFERWLETRRQQAEVKALFEAAQESPELARLVLDLAKTHAGVSAGYRLMSSAPQAKPPTDGSDSP